MDDPMWTVAAASTGLSMVAVAVGVRNRHRIQRRLGLWLLGLALVLLGQPVAVVHCWRCHRRVDAFCKAHLDELASR